MMRGDQQIPGTPARETLTFPRTPVVTFSRYRSRDRCPVVYTPSRRPLPDRVLHPEPLSDHLEHQAGVHRWSQSHDPPDRDQLGPPTPLTAPWRACTFRRPAETNARHRKAPCLTPPHHLPQAHPQLRCYLRRHRALHEPLRSLQTNPCTPDVFRVGEPASIMSTASLADTPTKINNSPPARRRQPQ
jgi:hypothetical protein